MSIFFLVHNQVSQNNIEMLMDLCQEISNIAFHEVRVPNFEQYTIFSEGGPVAAYFPICAHLLLPDTVQRVLYIDAGDILILGDISPYYNCSFEDNMLIVTGVSYKKRQDTLMPYTADDLGDWNIALPRILRGLFNSGSYMMNLEKMRQENINLNDFRLLAEKIHEIQNDFGSNSYFGDQGLLSAAFVGNIKYYDFERIQDIWHMPYNHLIWYFGQKSQKPNYTPIIVHFTGVAFKPWQGKYPICVKRFQENDKLFSLSQLKLGQAEYYYLWHEYAIMTERILVQIGY